MGNSADVKRRAFAFDHVVRGWSVDTASLVAVAAFPIDDEADVRDEFAAAVTSIARRIASEPFATEADARISCIEAVRNYEVLAREFSETAYERRFAAALTAAASAAAAASRPPGAAPAETVEPVRVTRVPDSRAGAGPAPRAAAMEVRNVERGEAWAWVVFAVLWCWPAGIVAAGFALQMNSLIRAGESGAAYKAARGAKVASQLGLLVTLLIIVLVLAERR